MIATIIVVPSILFLIIFDRNMQVNLEQEALKENKVTSSLIANSIEQLVIANDNTIEGIEFAIEAYGFVPTDIHEQLDHVIDESDFITKIEILNSEGILQFSSDHDAIVGINKSGEQFYIETMNGNSDYHWSSPYIPPLESNLVVSIAHLAGDNIIVGYIDISSLTDIDRYITAERDENVNIVVTDEYGLFIISSNPDEVTRRYRFEHFDELKTSLNEGVDTKYINHEGYKALATITETSNGWYVITYENLSSINALEISIRNQFSLFIVSIIVVTVLLVYYAVNSLKRSFDTVANKMHQVTAGELSTEINERSLYEINQIIDSFNTMTNSLRVSNEEIIRKSRTDTLTGLMTRKALHEYLETFKDQYDQNYVIFYIDIDRFAVINESYGIDFADKCLIEFAKRLELFEDAILSRAESDEFALLFNKMLSRAACIEIIDKLKLILGRPLRIDGIEILLSAKVGVSRYPVEEQNISHLITSAGIALNNAKELNRFHMFYETEMGKGYQRSVELEVSLVDAIRNNEFYAVLQPIVDCTDNTIDRFELLARWKHPSIGNIAPNDFIPLLERTNNIHYLDLLVLESAIQYHQKLKEMFNKEFIMCVNLSVKHIQRNDFVYRLISLVEQYKIDPKFIELEVTETIFVSDYELVKDKMTELIAAGFNFSQDDFGDGYSSLSYLARLELSTLKISKSFLENLTSTNNQIMLESVVKLSQKLGMEIIVEGVEDEETLNFFKKFDCRLIQGYYYFRPDTFENIVEILKDAL